MGKILVTLPPARRAKLTGVTAVEEKQFHNSSWKPSVRSFCLEKRKQSLLNEVKQSCRAKPLPAPIFLSRWMLWDHHSNVVFSQVFGAFFFSNSKKTNVLEESILKVFCINTRGNGWPRSLKGWKGNSAAKDSPASFLKVVGCVQQRRKSWVHSEAVISHLGAHYFLRSVKVKIRAIFKRVCTWAKSDTEKTGCQKLQVRGQQEI